MADSKWYAKSYRRNLVDMHIDDWDERFLSQFDPRAYVALLRKAHVQSAMVYANSHVGHCYWPTQSGNMHRGLKGRDAFGKIVGGCHAAGMDVIAYYSLIFNNWAHEQHPSWRMVDEDGRHSRERGRDLFRLNGRYGLLCPNNQEYRRFVDDQVREICAQYSLEGIFFDMIFWPMVCYCPSCRERFDSEVGGDLPAVVDWRDPRWLAFQSKREEWLAEFAAFANNVAKKYCPGISVEINSAPLTQMWKTGTTLALRDQNDYIGGDLYGGFGEQSFICKFYHSITPNQPFEYMTSRCEPSLLDHTTLKSTTSLRLHACLTLAHNGAFLFIDAVDPSGTLNTEVFERVGGVFEETIRYEPHLGGDLCGDVAVYVSLDSKYDPGESGKPAETGGRPFAHLTAAQGAARALRESHIPFSVIGANSLDDLSSVRVLVLSQLAVISDDEAAKIRRFVAAGGGLYASGRIAAGVLVDLFGLTLEEETNESVTYMALTERGRSLLGDMTAGYPLSVWGTQVKARAADPGDIVATLALPFTVPWKEDRFASIHSNPPGVDTEYASIVYRRVGKGRVVWTAAPLENDAREPHRKAFVGLMRELCGRPFQFEADAPPAVEVIAFHQPERKRYLINLVNEQELLPPVTASGIRVRLRLDEREALRACSLPDGEELPFTTKGDCIEIEAPPLDLFRMLAVDYD